MIFEKKDVKDFARGAAFLGAGGGGDPYIGSLMLEEAMRTRPVELMPLENVPDDAWLTTVAMMGAPSVMVEKLPNGDEGDAALRAIEKAIGEPIFGIIAPEIGGLNALLPVIVATRLGLPIIDADGMGRAFPELQMVTFSIFGQSASPMAICDEVGNCVTVQAVDNAAAERLARQTVVTMGGCAHICCYPMLGRQAKLSAISGTLSIALELGRQMRKAREGAGSPIDAVLEYLSTVKYYHHSKRLIEGKITGLKRSVEHGFTVGALTIEGRSGTSALEVEFRNEFLVARSQGKTVAIVPDLIVVLDQETGEPVTVEALKFGQRVCVLGISAPPILRDNRSLQSVGPRCFNLDEEFQALESIL